MHVHCYRNKTGKQFVDFLKRVDKRYDKNIQNIFLVLDNLSAHKSKMVKEVLAKYCPRIKLVFLPVRSPELNLIEVRWLWLQRQAINNSTFKDGQEIGQAVSKWKNIYNKIMAKQSQIFYKREYSCVYTTVNLTILSTVLKLSTVLFSPSFSIIMLI
jgi:transposase